MTFLKLCVIGVGLLALACGPARGCPFGSASAPPSDPDLPANADDEAVRTACEAAGRRLQLGDGEGRPCAEARADFGRFCFDELRAGVPLRPVCLSKVASCADVDGCQR